MKKSRRVHRTPVEEVDPKKVKKKGRQAPSTTIEGREQQLIALAISLAEKQIRAGTASSQVMTHFLKLGSTMEDLEKEKLKKENQLLQAKTEALQSAKKVEALISDALKAMQIYSGNTSEKAKISSDKRFEDEDG